MKIKCENITYTVHHCVIDHFLSSRKNWQKRDRQFAPIISTLKEENRVEHCILKNAPWACGISEMCKVVTDWWASIL